MPSNRFRMSILTIDLLFTNLDNTNTTYKFNVAFKLFFSELQLNKELCIATGVLKFQMFINTSLSQFFKLNDHHFQGLLLSYWALVESAFLLSLLRSALGRETETCYFSDPVLCIIWVKWSLHLVRRCIGRHKDKQWSQLIIE